MSRYDVERVLAENPLPVRLAPGGHTGARPGAGGARRVALPLPAPFPPRAGRPSPAQTELCRPHLRPHGRALALFRLPGRRRRHRFRRGLRRGRLYRRAADPGRTWPAAPGGRPAPPHSAPSPARAGVGSRGTSPPGRTAKRRGPLARPERRLYEALAVAWRYYSLDGLTALARRRI